MRSAQRQNTNKYQTRNERPQRGLKLGAVDAIRDADFEQLLAGERMKAITSDFVASEGRSVRAKIARKQPCTHVLNNGHCGDWFRLRTHVLVSAYDTTTIVPQAPMQRLLSSQATQPD